MTVESEALQDAAQQHAEQAEEHDRNYFAISDNPEHRRLAGYALANPTPPVFVTPEGTT